MKILLADDDKIERTVLRDIIGAHPGLEVIEVEDGQAALDALCDGLKPDFCIFDIRMPKIDGVELLRRLRRDPLLRGLKVVMTSASRDRDTIIALAKLQIGGYLLKPYDPAKVKAVVDPLLATTTKPELITRNLLGRTALIVDDEDVCRVVLQGMVRAEAGWVTDEAKTGREALVKLHAGLRPELIFVDLRMPDMDGATFVNRVREDPLLRSLSIVITSAVQDREQIAAIGTLGVRAFVPKPFDATKIVGLLRQNREEN